MLWHQRLDQPLPAGALLVNVSHHHLAALMSKAGCTGIANALRAACIAGFCASAYALMGSGIEPHDDGDSENSSQVSSRMQPLHHSLRLVDHAPARTAGRLVGWQSAFRPSRLSSASSTGGCVAHERLVCSLCIGIASFSSIRPEINLSTMRGCSMPRLSLISSRGACRKSTVRNGLKLEASASRGLAKANLDSISCAIHTYIDSTQYSISHCACGGSG